MLGNINNLITGLLIYPSLIELLSISYDSIQPMSATAWNQFSIVK